MVGIHTVDAVNQALLAKVIRAQLLGKTPLPYGLGLSPSLYKELFQGCQTSELLQLEQQWHQPHWTPCRERAEVCAELHTLRADEQQQLTALMQNYAQPSVAYAPVVANIIANACMGNSHLYSDLGFESRSELRTLIAHNFPNLCELNSNNMRWKRFLYLQLCKNGGDYVCRAPSCDECSSRKECFVT